MSIFTLPSLDRSLRDSLSPNDYSLYQAVRRRLGVLNHDYKVVANKIATGIQNSDIPNESKLNIVLSIINWVKHIRRELRYNRPLEVHWLRA